MLIAHYKKKVTQQLETVNIAEMCIISKGTLGSLGCLLHLLCRPLDFHPMCQAYLLVFILLLAVWTGFLYL